MLNNLGVRGFICVSGEATTVAQYASSQAAEVSHYSNLSQSEWFYAFVQGRTKNLWHSGNLCSVVTCAAVVPSCLGYLCSQCTSMAGLPVQLGYHYAWLTCVAGVPAWLGYLCSWCTSMAGLPVQLGYLCS